MSPTIASACTRHCGDGCSLLVTPGQDGSLAIAGNPEHPFTKGFLCAKTARFSERLRSPRRIVTPLMRDGARLREATWEQALERIAREIARLRHTPERMLHIHYYASFGLLHQASKLLFTRLTSSTFSGSPCLRAGMAAQAADFGALRQAPLELAARAPTIVNWGRNASVQSVHLAALLAKARKRGSRLIAIHPGDPGYQDGATQHILIRPGTDRFLALAVLAILAEEGHLDRHALERSSGTPGFLELLRVQNIDRLLDMCGVTVDGAQTLAGVYAAEQPVATLIGRGLQRYASGGENVRFIDALAMLSGQMMRQGAGVYFHRPDQTGPGWDWTSASPGYSRSFPLAGLARHVQSAQPPVEFVWVEGMNLVTQCPESLATAAMLRERFTVVVEPFLTDTAREATVVLPPALMLECEDIVASESHECINHSAKVADPPGLCRSNFDIASALGALLDPPVLFPKAEAVMDTALRTVAPSTSLAALRKKGFLEMASRPQPWTDGIFAHPDGLYRLPEALTPEPAPPGGYPLRLLSTVRQGHLLSQIPEDEQPPVPTVYVAPSCPALKRLQAGAEQPLPAVLATELGSMPVLVAVMEGLHPEAVYYPRGDWLSRGGCVNRLIRARQADMGGQVAYYAQWAALSPATS